MKFIGIFKYDTYLPTPTQDLSKIAVAFKFKPVEKILQGDKLSNKMVNCINYDLEKMFPNLYRDPFRKGQMYEITGYFYLNKYGTKYYFKTESIHESTGNN